MRRLFLTLICVAARAQTFNGLAVTDDASEVYFATGQRLKSEAPLGNSHAQAIHRLSGGVIRRLTDPIFAAGWSEGDSNAQVTGDGAVFLYTHWYYCSGGSSCITRPTTATSALVARDGAPVPIPGAAQMSHDGRFVWSIVPVYSSSGLNRRDTYPLLDRRSGATVSVPVPPASARQAVAEDGRVLGLSAGKLILWGPESTKDIPIPRTVTAAILDRSARWIVYTSAGELRSFDTATGRDTVLAPAGLSPTFSADGASVLYLAGGQAWIARTDGSSVRQLTGLPEGVDHATLAGSGRTVIAATGGRLVAIDTASGDIRELILRAPVCNPGFTALTPGSILPFRGSAMARATAVASPPLPGRLADTVVSMDGRPLPLLSVSPAELWFQVPFDAPIGTRVSIGVENASLFDGCNTASQEVVARAPYFLGAGSLIVAHAGLAGLVTPESRARPGEIVTLWAVGLGSVDPPVPTGLPTPAEPLSRLDKPFDCRAGWRADSPALEVVFAGLAPGMIGVYQVNVRLPDPTPAEGFVFLSCGTPGSETERHGGPIPTVLRAP